MSQTSLFFEFNSHPRRVVRKDPDGAMAELVDGVWRPAPWRNPPDDGCTNAQIERAELDLRCRQRLNLGDLDEPTKTWVGRHSQRSGRGAGRSQTRLRRVAMWVLPPLPYGAPFRFDEQAYDNAQSAFEEELAGLGDGSFDVVATLERARDGHRSQETWLQNIETRASAFGSYASAVAGLVGVGVAILSRRDHSIPVTLQIALIALLVSTMWCLVVSGFRGWQASYKRIDRARPHDSRRLLRCPQATGAAYQRAELAALLVAEHRGSVLEDWKLERLKQSSRFFALALIALLVAALLLILAPAS